MHGDLIKAGQVELLTYKQLRSLERIDAKKDREAAYAELAKEGIRATGQALEGAFAGLGLALQGYLSGDALAFAAKSVAGLAFLAWLINSFPNFSKFTHIDQLFFGGGGKPIDVTTLNNGAVSDIEELQAQSIPVPTWLTQIRDAKTLSQMPDLTFPITTYFTDYRQRIAWVSKFENDLISAVTDAHTAALEADIHELVQVYIAYYKTHGGGPSPGANRGGRTAAG